MYLNDSGTKKKGLCYLDKLTDGIFECIQETTTTVNNTTYFKNFSNKENSDRLSNLIKSEVLTSEEYVDNNTNGIREFIFNNIPKEYNIISALSLDATGLAQENITVNVDSSNKIVNITSCFLIFNDSKKQHKIIIFYI